MHDILKHFIEAINELSIPFPSRSTAHQYSKYISYFKCEFKITRKGNLSQVNWTIIHCTLFYGVVYVFGDLHGCVIDMNFDFSPLISKMHSSNETVPYFNEFKSILMKL